MTLGFLFLTTIFLLCLRAMQCNKTSIINNGATALFLSELIFILGINQADNPVITNRLFPCLAPPPPTALKVLITPLSLLHRAAVSVHRHRHPAAFLLPLHFLLALPGGAACLPHDQRSQRHQLWTHEILLPDWLGSSCLYHRSEP